MSKSYWFTSPKSLTLGLTWQSGNVSRSESRNVSRDESGNVSRGEPSLYRRGRERSDGSGVVGNGLEGKYMWTPYCRHVGK